MLSLSIFSPMSILLRASAVFQKQTQDSGHVQIYGPDSGLLHSVSMRRAAVGVGLPEIPIRL
jgi:hypothetical protein